MATEVGIDVQIEVRKAVSSLVKISDHFNKIGAKAGKVGKTADTAMGRVAKSTNNATNQVTRLGDQLIEVAQNLSVIQGPLGPLAGRIRALGVAINRFGEVSAFAVTAALAFGKVIKDIGIWAAQTALRFERIYQSVKFASDGMVDFSNNIAFVIANSRNLGIDLESSAKGFSKLAAATKGTSLAGDETRKAFVALTSASSALRLSAADTEGVIRAVTQMISKGKVQAEELRGQLGERLPGAFGMAAQAIGVTTRELDAMLENGEVITDEFLPKFIDLMQNRFGQAAEDAAKTASASFTNLKNEISLFGDTVGQAVLKVVQPAVDAAVAVLRDLNQYMAPPKAELSPRGRMQKALEAPKLGAIGATEKRIDKLKERIASLSLESSGGRLIKKRGVDSGFYDHLLDSLDNLEIKLGNLKTSESELANIRYAAIDAQETAVDNLNNKLNAQIEVTNRAEDAYDRIMTSAATPHQKALQQVEELMAAAAKIGKEGSEETKAAIETILAPFEKLGELDLITAQFEKMEKQYDANQRKAEAYAKSQSKIAEQIKRSVNPYYEYNEKLKQANQLKKEGLLVGDDYLEYLFKLENELEDKVTPAFEKSADDIKSAWEKAMDSLRSTTQDGITDLILRFRSFGDVVNSIGNQIAKTIMNKYISEPLTTSLFGSGDGDDGIVGEFLKSFDGGGYTGSGARSGGVDGRGGFPAILHPNETVIDHTKGQKMGGDVVNVTYSPQVNALDPRTAATVIAQNAPTVVGIIEQAMNRRGRTAFA